MCLLLLSEVALRVLLRFPVSLLLFCHGGVVPHLGSGLSVSTISQLSVVQCCRRRGLGPRGPMEQQRQQPGLSPLANQQQLGRRAALCAPTEQLHQYRWERYWPDHPKYDPFKDDRKEVRLPHLVGPGHSVNSSGDSRGVEKEYTLRQPQLPQQHL